MAENFVTLARVARTHGRHGELAADSYTDIPERFTRIAARRGEVWLQPAGGGARQAFRLCGERRHGERVILELEGIADLTAAERWVGAEVQVPAAERASAPDGAYFQTDLVGCEAWTDGRCLGWITSVEEIGGAAPLLHISGTEGGERLVPFVAAFVRSVDMDARRVELVLPEGLLEINEK